MAKEKEKKLARFYYVDKKLDAKIAAEKAGISAVTMSKWVNAFGWKEQRAAIISNPGVQTDNIKLIINKLAEDRLKLDNELNGETDKDNILELRKQIAGIDAAVANWNKTLTTVDKENQISLSVYLNVMEMLFNSMREFDEKLFLQSIDFQETHLNEVSIRFK